MAITWNHPSLDLGTYDHVHTYSISIFASNDQVDPDPGAAEYGVVSETLNDNAIIFVDSGGVTISGNTSELYPGEDIKYLDGIVPGTASIITDVPYSANPYEWLADGTIIQHFTITVNVFYAGTSESSQETFTVHIRNNWDAHRLNVYNLSIGNY